MQRLVELDCGDRERTESQSRPMTGTLMFGPAWRDQPWQTGVSTPPSTFPIRIRFHTANQKFACISNFHDRNNRFFTKQLGKKWIVMIDRCKCDEFYRALSFSLCLWKRILERASWKHPKMASVVMWVSVSDLYFSLYFQALFGARLQSPSCKWSKWQSRCSLLLLNRPSLFPNYKPSILHPSTCIQAFK